MPNRSMPGLGLRAFTLGENGWDDEYNADHQKLSALANGNVKSRVTALPGTPTLGDIYIVPSGAGSNPNEVAIWDGVAGSEVWVYLTPDAGWTFYVEDEAKNYQYNGTDWIEFAVALGGAAIENITGTAYTQVAADTGKWKRTTNAAAVTITIDDAVNSAGDEITFEQAGAGLVTFAAGAGVTLNSRGGVLASAGQFAIIGLKFISASEATLFGDIA